VNDLAKTILILLAWTALIKMAGVFVAYAPTLGYNQTLISGSLLATGAWGAILTYMIIILRSDK
jgi:hypothetical protein